jgi:hypothetical protein
MTNGETGDVKRRLFISYGRTDASDLAIKLSAELSARGFEVWLDKARIRAGKAWEDQILDGLRASDVMIAILSPHSTRRVDDGDGVSDSVCLDEIAFARYEHPPIPIIPVMGVRGANIPLTILRLHYIDFVDALISEEIFGTRLSELLTAIDDAVSGIITYKDWESWLAPIVDFGRFLYQKRRGFVGRAWLFEQIEQWRTTSSESALIIAGEPGIGKSAILAELALGSLAARTIATHCCQWDVQETLRPATFVRGIAYQCASRLPEYASKIVAPELRRFLERADLDPASAFELSVLNPLGQLKAPPEAPLLLCIDALDEAASFNEGSNILDLLASWIERLPSWIKIIATTRPDTTVMRKLGRVRTMVLDPASNENIADLRHYVTSQIEDLGDSDIEQVAVAQESLIQQSGGSFLYTEHVLQAVLHGRMNLNDLGNLPPGLDGTYERFLRRTFSADEEFQKIRPVLEVIGAAEEPIPRSLIANAAGLELRELVRGIAPLIPLLRQTRTSNEQQHPAISFWHKSFYDFLTGVEHADSDFSIEPAAGHWAIASAFIDRASRFDKALESGSSGSPELRDAGDAYLRLRGIDHLALSGRFLHDLSDDLVNRLVYFSARNSGMFVVGRLPAFAPVFIREALLAERLDDIRRLLKALEHTTRIHYIDSGLIRSEIQSDGTEQRIITGRATEAGPLRAAMVTTGYAAWVTDQVLAMRGMDSTYLEMLVPLDGMRYIAGGLDIAGWAHGLSGYFADQGSALYRMLSNLKKGIRAEVWK